MYRCAACDNPTPDHHDECVMTDQQPQQQEERINIASGEDVVLEYQ